MRLSVGDVGVGVGGVVRWWRRVRKREKDGEMENVGWREREKRGGGVRGKERQRLGERSCI